jgi:hypothetical protein
MNMPTLNWYDHNRVFRNLIYGGDWTYDSGTTVPLANRDANGWVSSVPAGATTSISHPLTYPSPADMAKTFQMTWTGPTTGVTVVGDVTNVTVVSPGVITFQFTHNNSEPMTSGDSGGGAMVGPTRINYPISTIGADYPRNFDVREADASTSEIYHPDYLASLSGMKALRFMQANNVDKNVSAVSWTGRNVMGGGSYIGNNGIPVEEQVRLANTASVDPWLCLPWAADDTYVTNFATHIRDNLNAGRVAYIEVANEPWNSAYTILLNQMQAEGLAAGFASVNGVAISSITFSGTTATVTTATAHGMSGTGFSVTVTGASPALYNVSKVTATVVNSTSFTYTMSGTPASNATTVGSYTQINRYAAGLYRYAERVAQVMSLFDSVFTTPADQARIVRCYGMQNISPTVLLTQLDWVHPTLGLISNYVDAMAVAPYIDPGVISSTTTVDDVFAALPGATTSTFAATSTHKSNAVARGKRLICYEASPAIQQWSPADLTKSQAIARDDRFYTYIMGTFLPGYFKVNNDLCVLFDNPNFIQSSAQWGFTEYMGQTISRATTPKMQGLIDRIGAGLVLADLTDTLSISSGAANGASAGSVTRSFYGSTFSTTSTVFAVNSTTGAVTLIDSAHLPAPGSSTVPITETLGTQTHTTAVPLTVTAAWTPATPGLAFVGWYDPSDISTLWKDTARTIPVTADGDLVAAMDDKSGNGNRVFQATSGNRPVYRAGSGKPYLEGDGTKWMATSAAIALTGVNGEHSAAAGVVFNSNATQQRFVDGDVVTRVGQFLRNNVGTAESISFAGGSPFTDSGGALSTSASTTMIQVTRSPSPKNVELYVNGASNGATAVSGTLQTAAEKLGIMGSSSGGAPLNGKFYGAFTYAAQMSATDISNAHNWLAAKMT